MSRAKHTSTIAVPPPVPSKRVAALQRALRTACERKVVRWEWADGECWPTTPLKFERLREKPGRILARPPKHPTPGMWSCGFDDEGRMLVKRAHRADGVAEALFEHRGDIVDEHYFFTGEPRCTVTRYTYRRKRLVGVVHVYDSGDTSTVRYTWRAGHLVKLVSRGSGHDYDELFEYDADGLVSITRVHQDAAGGRNEVYRRRGRAPRTRGPGTTRSAKGR